MNYYSCMWLHLVFLVLYPAMSIHAQSKTMIDSLENLIEKGGEDTLKAKHLNDLVWYIKFSDPDTSLILLEQSEALSKKLDFADGLGNSYNNRAIIYTVSGNFQDALKYYSLAIEQFKRNRDAEGVGFCLSNMAICFEYQSQFDSALVYNKKALEVRLKHNLEKGIAQSNINIGVIYFNKGFYRTALKHYLDALEFYENKPGKTAIDSSYLGSVQNNIGNIYIELKNSKLARKYLRDALRYYSGVADSRELAYLHNDLGNAASLAGKENEAVTYFRKALAWADQSGDKLIETHSLMNLARSKMLAHQPDSAISFAAMGIEKSSEISDKKYAVGLYLILGKAYQQKHQYRTATKNLKKALQMSEESDIIKQRDEILYELARCYAALGNLKKANDYLELHITASDSILNEEKHRQIAEMEALYENEKKTRQLELKAAENTILQQENKLQATLLAGKNRLIVSIVVGLILAGTALVMLFFQYRRKEEAYNVLYRKNLEMMNKAADKKQGQALRNGDLFMDIERRMKEEKIFTKKDLSRDTLAQITGSNREYVQQAIKDHVGKTVSEYITNYRIIEAMQLLSDPETLKSKTIDAIPDEIGLKSTSTFYRIFKDSTGMTPLQFQKQAKK